MKDSDPNSVSVDRVMNAFLRRLAEQQLAQAQARWIVVVNIDEPEKGSVKYFGYGQTI